MPDKKSDRLVDSYLTDRHGASKPGGRSRQESFRANYISYLPDEKNAKIIEIGPGFGEVLEVVVKEMCYCNVSIVDNSIGVVEHCSAHFPVTGVVSGDLVSHFTQLEKESVDTVLMLHVLEHLPRNITVEVLAAIRGSLKPGGRLLVEVPNMANPVMGAIHRYHDFTHQVGFTDLSLAQVLKAAGYGEFAVVRVRPPRGGAARFVQYGLQRLIEGIHGLLARVYAPRGAVLRSQYIAAIATK